jgi:hypothetical protein
MQLCLAHRQNGMASHTEWLTTGEGSLLVPQASIEPCSPLQLPLVFSQ